MLPKLGLLADFSSTRCPVASYVSHISKGLEQYFAIHNLDLKTSQLIYPHHLYPYYDEYFVTLLPQIESLDVVEISLEFGIYGKTFENVTRRLQQIVSHAKRVVITVHSCHMDGGGFQAFYTDFFAHVKEQMKHKPILIIVNNDTDAKVMDAFGIKYAKFPICYFTEEVISKLISQNIFQQKDHPVHKLLHFNVEKGDVLLGMLGFISDPNKDCTTVIKALSLLPQNYKLLLLGSQHPASKVIGQKNQTIMDIVSTIASIDSASENGLKLMDRIAFLDHLPDGVFHEIQASLDFVIAPYLETRMSSSSVMAQSLQLERKVIGSICTTFDNLSEFYPNCFEQIDFGNYYQLRNKILTFNPSKVENIRRCSKQWSVESLSILYNDFYHSVFTKMPEVESVEVDYRSIKPKLTRWQKFRRSLAKRGLFV